MSILRKDVNKILIKIKKGDEKSKNVLFEKTYNHLKIVAYSYVTNKDDLEDIVIEAYLRIFQYIHNFDSNKDGYNWMCKIVQNVAYDWAKKLTCEIPLDGLSKKSQMIDFEEKLIIEDEVRCLLQGYSEQDQKMMYFRFWENRTIEEIALALDMSKSNVHKRISKILKEILQKEKNKVEKQSRK